MIRSANNALHHHGVPMHVTQARHQNVGWSREGSLLPVEDADVVKDRDGRSLLRLSRVEKGDRIRQADGGCADRFSEHLLAVIK
jgi:hypothetical protein